MLSAVGLTGGGLIGLIQWLRGRKPSRIEKNEDSAVFECAAAQTIETYTVSLLTAKLYESHTVRQSMAKILKPLEREGI
ncbi:hypothetical protein, partial [Ventosimonas gracilis]|uniref:hypothetical protein n=1 Tax=Ventosimonas gracilis TaxID=1680762 RepID=UPI0019586035